MSLKPGSRTSVRHYGAIGITPDSYSPALAWNRMPGPDMPPRPSGRPAVTALALMAAPRPPPPCIECRLASRIHGLALMAASRPPPFAFDVTSGLLPGEKFPVMAVLFSRGALAGWQSGSFDEWAHRCPGHEALYARAYVFAVPPELWTASVPGPGRGRAFCRAAAGSCRGVEGQLAGRPGGRPGFAKTIYESACNGTRRASASATELSLAATRRSLPVSAHGGRVLWKDPRRQRRLRWPYANLARVGDPSPWLAAAAAATAAA